MMSATPTSAEARYRNEWFAPLSDGYAAETVAPYWTWKRLSMFVLTMKTGRTPTPGEWQALHREIPGLSLTKKIWLYRQMRSYFSPEALNYLFRGWRPPSPNVNLDPWL
jgi:hypothetical protein